MVRRYFILCVAFSLWTIVQSSLHVLVAIYAYYMSVCEKKPTQASTIFFYLTYLYNKKCAIPKLQNFNQLEPTSLETYVVTALKNVLSENTEITLHEIVDKLLARLDLFPDYATASSKTSIFLLCFIILDGTWMVTAVALMMGSCFGIKQTLSLIFYGPWLVMTLCILIFDASASIAFALDIPHTQNFTQWMEFVGIEETSTFEDFDARKSSIFIPLPLTPTVALCSISSRFVIIWVSNLVGFFYMIKATIYVYKDSYKGQSKRDNTQRPPVRSQMDLNTSADRIRSWQMFYGPISTTSSHSSNSAQTERDLSANKESDVEEGSLGNCYFAYPDVAENIDKGGSACLDELRSQLPWSYIPTQEGSRKCVSEERLELESRNRRNFRIKSDSSSVSGTEL